MENRTEVEHIRVCKELHKKLVTKGSKTQLQRLDNKAPKKLITEITKNDYKYRLVPPNNHRTNAVERGVQTFKAHFIRSLCIIDPSYPLYLWDYLLNQEEMTLNIQYKPTDISIQTLKWNICLQCNTYGTNGN